MTTYETISCIMSGTAFILSLISLIFTKINMNKVERIYYGQSELAIREAITSAKNRITDVLASGNVNDNPYTAQCIRVATEQLLNSYEEACAKYLDAKIDKKRFKKTYIDEIKGIVENDTLKQFFIFGSKYDAIKKVYMQWFNLEK